MIEVFLSLLAILAGILFFFCVPILLLLAFMFCVCQLSLLIEERRERRQRMHFSNRW